MIVKNSRVIKKILDKYMKRPETTVSNSPSKSESPTMRDEPRSPELSDTEIMKKMRTAGNPLRFILLMAGKWNLRFRSHSEADLALCKMIAFWTQIPEQIERIFNLSKLAERNKWHYREDYRRRTIDQALRATKQTYSYFQQNYPDDLPLPLFCDWIEKKQKHEPDKMKFLEYLKDQGFYHINHEGIIVLCRIRNHTVESVDPEKIKRFVIRALTRKKHEHELEALVESNQNFFAKSFLEYLPVRKIKLIKDTPTTAYKLFRNAYVEVKAFEFTILKYKTLKEKNLYVWKDQKIAWAIKLVKGRGEFENFTRNVASYLQPPKQKGLQRKANKYGHFLHIKKLQVLKSAIGEKCHGYKDPAKAVATVFVDSDISEHPQGGTGKSLVGRSLMSVMKTVEIDGKSNKPYSRFALQDVDIDTQLLFYDDVGDKFPLDALLHKITGSLTFEKKMQQSVTIPFESAPKILITSNHPILGEGLSYERRQHIVEFSDFYHHHIPLEVHGSRRLFDEWDDDEWSRFYLFIIKCIQFYLKNGLVMDTSRAYKDRKLRNECTSPFVDWADYYFKIGKTHKKDDAYRDLLNTLNLAPDKYSKHTFTTTLKKYALGRGLELNPNKRDQRDRRGGIDYLTLMRKGRKKKREPD